ncbi:MAG: hypothetical protein AAF639_18870 [Chloroflexota bacterium]
MYKRLGTKTNFTCAFELRKKLRQLYQARRLDETQTNQLAALDRIALTLAADLGMVYGLTLRQLSQNLST